MVKLADDDSIAKKGVSNEEEPRTCDDKLARYVEKMQDEWKAVQKQNMEKCVEDCQKLEELNNVMELKLYQLLKEKIRKNSELEMKLSFVTREI
ncbi:OLC1v1006058C1 [Oldenlandia corymbosa var. corymbosa]|uniref:OLC1v1006058C1 n=1 Tax=Oldenlandia corymbosa var. corymbosa TaxID=529605 RepID=A0AAV1DG31_OLDCO|nr:OLC1v1006058C1 [Oldenlandia corymbosa var. corymbosa]